VLVSSLRVAESAPGRAEHLLACDAGTFRISTNYLPAKFSGAGDLLAALFLFHVLRGSDAPSAALAAVRSIAGVLLRTWQANDMELHLVQAQNEFVAPSGDAEIAVC
jgi:pyridoxine kinase